MDARDERMTGLNPCLSPSAFSPDRIGPVKDRPSSERRGIRVVQLTMELLALPFLAYAAFVVLSMLVTAARHPVRGTMTKNR